MIEYENQMFLDLFHEDGLLVTGRGLGIDRIFIDFLKLYCDPGNLVLVLNAGDKEKEYFIDELRKQGTSPLPKIITTEYNANDRHSIYMQGGALFVTSRILVVDMLTERLPIDLVTGILVFKAHKIVESCQEAFIIRLYRQKNKVGFVKAFSDSPQSFTAGFCQVERVMKSLFVRKLYLWPRFHASVVSCLDEHKAEVVELHLQLTPAMLACQTALLDLINACIKELKRYNPTFDTDEITVENAITKSFDQIIRLHLDPIWHQLGAKTRQLVADIKTLRLLLKHLTQYDCITFYNLVDSIRSNEITFGQNSGWLFLEAADNLFTHAKERVYGPAKKTKKVKSSEENLDPVKSDAKGPVLEECPKWKILAEILKEIEEENESVSSTLGPGRVLIAAEDDRTCNQIKQYLSDGGHTLLKRLFDKSVGRKTGQKVAEESSAATRGRWKGKGKGKSSAKNTKSKSELTLTQMVDSHNKEEADDDDDKVSASTEEDTDSVEEEDKQPPSSDAYYGVLQEPVTVLHPLHGCNDPYGLVRTLKDVQPRYVILYDADMVFVRQLELFKASRPGTPLRVYFLVYAGSVEEQRYLTTLRKEKEAFELLIKEKATMVIPEEREGRLQNDPSLSRDPKSTNASSSTRKGGVEPEPPVQQKIIVDMREFRSELPSLIHRRGIDIEPVTIEVGDYILTPDICVERKSVSDLIGSLNNGRLYNQCAAMSRYYKRPVLLIEFDASKPFTLQGKSQYMSSDISSQDVTSRLALLTLHYPQLRILWCQSPYATAELFEELKVGREQPDAAAAMTVTAETELTEIPEKYNMGPQNFLLKLPGISTKNVYAVMNAVHDLSELVSLSEERIAEILENKAHAKTLWDFLHSEQKQVESTAVQKQPLSKFGKGFKRKR
ncbi:DNA repair endonuclease XPF-like [Lingula anatina]|uniref:DNA repair endonuclease XPF n=1 Tax=Lingula anatina TaxID=7574 RepID=A0A1S3J1P2_LINAN|nr:DNA repair endonuclease XPF-like [Lingula anatina]|eukprot:XP_013404181.1 DNA repair endonuclease XPF-like [Lingula anatina]